MYIQRNLEHNIFQYLHAPEILAIVGPRRSGKSTMIQHILKDQESVHTLSFDDREVLNTFEKDPDTFISVHVKGKKILFIDEFQYAKEGGRILKYIYDTEKIKIIISGSSAIDITIRAVKYLVGRVFILELFPFNFEEFLRARNPDYLGVYEEYKKNRLADRENIKDPSDEIHKIFSRFYEEYLIFGGYPEVVLASNPEIKKTILTNIMNTYFLREVRDIVGLIDDYKLQNLMKALALQIGDLIEYQELSRLSEFPYQALKRYLNLLEKTYICRFIRPFFSNRRKEIIKNPKVYFFDTGLRNVIAKDFRKLSNRNDSGAVLENGLAMELIKAHKAFNFWRDKQKNEMDFVINLGDEKMVAIETKKYLNKTETKSMKHFKKTYPKIDVLLSYADKENKIKGENIHPVYLLG